MMEGTELFAKVSCFDLCDIIRLKWTTYSELLNAHIMHDGSGDFFGCVCN